jgi:hypothetical protein
VEAKLTARFSSCSRYLSRYGVQTPAVQVVVGNRRLHRVCDSWWWCAALVMPGCLISSGAEARIPGHICKLLICAGLPDELVELRRKWVQRWSN